MMQVAPDLAKERLKASFSAPALRDVICGRRPEVTERFKSLFDGPEFDSTDDAFLSYAELFKAQLSRAAAAVHIIRANPKLMATHQAQKVQMADLFDTGSMGSKSTPPSPSPPCKTAAHCADAPPHPSRPTP